MRGRAASLSAALLVSLAWGAPAGASESSDETAKSEVPMVGYGWRVALIDAAALALGGAALGIALADSPRDKSSATVLAVAGLGVYLAGPPILHGARGNATKVEESLGYRVGLPLAGATVGVIAGWVTYAGYRGWYSPAFPLVFGMVGAGVGALAAMVVDATVIAREPVLRTSALGVVPSFDPRSRSVGLTAVGRF
jgi:hypothetical protein